MPKNQLILLTLLTLVVGGCADKSTPSADQDKSMPETELSDAAEDSAPFDEEDTAPESAVATESIEPVVTGDWAMWGGDPSRNMVNGAVGMSMNFVTDELSNQLLELVKDESTSFENAVDKLDSSPPALENTARDLNKSGHITFTVEKNDAGDKTYSDIAITNKGKDALPRIRWTAALGSQTYGNPIVAGGKVFVGTNNGGEYREQHKGDRGCILCFNEEDGEFLWQLTREKLPQGRVNDWPEQGICSTPCIEDGLLYVATNRCELMCIDVEGFHDDENDGPYQDEADAEKQDADIVWSLDMLGDELGVFPHNLATSSPVIHGDLILLVTSNGVDEAHLEVPSPRAPSFIAVNKKTGELVWEDSSPSTDSMAPAPFDNILHGQWGSPALGEVNGKMQAFMPGGDGVLYSFDVESGDLVWWFDLNPKESVWELGGRGTRNAIISTPVFVDNSVILAVGQDPEHGEGVGHLYRIDATKTGDVSAKVAEGDGYKDNDNSGETWHYGGLEGDDLVFRRTISTVAVSDGLVYAPDLSGFLHCVDFATGEKKWEYDTFAAVWGSPMVVDGHVLLGDEDGEMVVLKAAATMEEVETKTFNSSIYSTPTIANGTMFVSDRSRLYAIKVQ